VGGWDGSKAWEDDKVSCINDEDGRSCIVGANARAVRFCEVDGAESEITGEPRLVKALES
jgi:hypothetical protein